jgi:predicted AlkP superfamily pyrophosphatase or phosphodiesterase
MNSGAYATSMEPVNPTITWPNHTTMVTGQTPTASYVAGTKKLGKRG